MANRSSGKLLFEIVYIQPFLYTLDIVFSHKLLGMSTIFYHLVDKIINVHDMLLSIRQTQISIGTFVGDQVMVHLWKRDFR